MKREPAKHGTRSRYNSKTHPCRCGKCKRANADYIARWRRLGQPWTEQQLPAAYWQWNETP